MERVRRKKGGRGEIRNEKKTYKRKQKIWFPKASLREPPYDTLACVSVCSFAQLSICQFAFRSYQTLLKALGWGPRHQRVCLCLLQMV